MATQIISNPARVHQYVCRQTHIPVSTGMKGIGLERDGELVAGVLYEGYNGKNVWMHVAAEPGKRWMTKDFLKYAFSYPFNEMKISRVSGWVEARNAAAIRFDEHLGFKREALLAGAASDGGDVIIYKMTREECRYV